MDWLIADIDEHGPATTQEEAEQRPVPDFEGRALVLERVRAATDRVLARMPLVAAG